MDRRSWPWKKKSSDKAAAEKAAAASESTVVSAPSVRSQGHQGKQDGYKKPNYVQISVESYTHLTGLEDQVKSYEEQVKALEDEVKELNEKLSAAESEITTKEGLVKQHAKVAEEAVSGWEKAEAEASALKNHLESVTLLKLTAEDRASHLDGALKECMRQIRNLKEEHEQNLHEVVLTKTKQWEKIKHEFVAKINNLDQELVRSSAENAAISRSLQERSNMLFKVSEEKSQAEADIEFLKSNIESCEKEINSLKYELHIATKELEIRNEEKNMSVKSAEVANKQHLEGIKKIAKLEAECQRLRGLVRKKLPGPAALAQMKLEVESLGHGYGETRDRRSPSKPPSPHQSSLPDFSLDTVHKYHKDNELLTERLLAMDEETKMLKEALTKRNSELQTSRNVCANTVSKLRSLEAQLLANGDYRSPQNSNVRLLTEGLLGQNVGTPRSFTTMSEDGNDEEASCAGSWVTSSVSELSHFRKEKNIESPNKSENANHLELMNDFLEMEKLANLSNDSNGTISAFDISGPSSEVVDNDTPVEVTSSIDSQSKAHHEMDHSQNQITTTVESALNPQSDADLLPLMRLQSRISRLFESKDAKMDNVLENIRQVVQDMHDNLHGQPVGSVVEATQSSDGACYYKASLVDAEVDTKMKISSSHDNKQSEEVVDIIAQELVAAISQIHDFILFLGREAKAVQDTSPYGNELSQKLEDFSTTFNDVIHNWKSLDSFILSLSNVLAEASELHFNVISYKYTEAENSSSDCIDKVALPENKDINDSAGQQYPNGCAHFSDSTSDPDIPHAGSFVPTSESSASWKCSLEEFEQMKSEKDNMALDLTRCTDNLGSTKSQLQETEQLLAEVKSQLTSAQKLNSLGETQLKCMAESYMTLETCSEELQTEVNILKTKLESLDSELEEEKRSHQESLARCKDLQEQLQRIQSFSTADNGAKTNQERELAAAAEKLAECQETIFLLGKQLNALRPQTELSTYSERSPKGDCLNEQETSAMNAQDIDPAEVDNNPQKVGCESPMDIYNAPFSPSDSDTNVVLRSPLSSKNTRHIPTKSGSSSSAPTPERHSRGFSRFFSSKGKDGH